MQLGLSRCLSTCNNLKSLSVLGHTWQGVTVSLQLVKNPKHSYHGADYIVKVWAPAVANCCARCGPQVQLLLLCMRPAYPVPLHAVAPFCRAGDSCLSHACTSATYLQDCRHASAVLCYRILTAPILPWPSPDGILPLQDAEKKLAMGPIENVIQGFGQCCGFPIQVLLHGTCTVPHSTFCQVECALTPAACNTWKGGQIDTYCRHVVCLQCPGRETHVRLLQGYETGGFSNGSSGGSAISPQGWM